MDLSPWEGMRESVKELFAWAEKWNVTLLPPVPWVGKATNGEWAGTADGTLLKAGRNRPNMGAWLLNKYGFPGMRVGDPMCGVGGLFLRYPYRVASFDGNDCVPARVDLARRNLARFLVTDDLHVQVGDARVWKPRHLLDLVITSPEYRDVNHSSGPGAKQQEIVQKHRMYQVQAFEVTDESLGAMSEEDFWAGCFEVYSRIHEALVPGGRVIVVLRNKVTKGREVDHVGRHIGLMRMAHLLVDEVLPRDLGAPSRFTMQKVARNPDQPYIRTEWKVLGRAPL